MKLSPVFAPEDKPVRSGWYCAACAAYYADNQRELIVCNMGSYLQPHDWLWYSTFWGKWFRHHRLCLPMRNQQQFWFGILK